MRSPRPAIKIRLVWPQTEFCAEPSPALPSSSYELWRPGLYHYHGSLPPLLSLFTLLPTNHRATIKTQENIIICSASAVHCAIFIRISNWPGQKLTHTRAGREIERVWWGGDTPVLLTVCPSVVSLLSLPGALAGESPSPPIGRSPGAALWRFS